MRNARTAPQMAWTLAVLLVALLAAGTVVPADGLNRELDAGDAHAWLQPELVEQLDAHFAFVEEEPAAATADDPKAAEAPRKPGDPPTLPPLKVGLKDEVAPAIHPASGVPANGTAPAAEELAKMPTPLHVPDGCSHLISAWQNYVWRWRTVNGSGVAGKDRYPQRVADERFGYFCHNLKAHQLLVNSPKTWRLTVRQPDLSFREVSPTRLTWNKYFDQPNLKHLRGFRYRKPFQHQTTHADYLKRDSVRSLHSDANPEARVETLKKRVEAAAATAAPNAPAPPQPPVAPGSQLMRPFGDEKPATAASATAAAPSAAADAPATSFLELAEEELDQVLLEIEEQLAAEDTLDTSDLDPVPAITTPTGATRQLARDPLIPDFDFSLNPNLIGPAMVQGNCGGDWAMAAVALIESSFALQCQAAPWNHSLAELHFTDPSPQQILSCAHKAQGCKGGDIETALRYAMRWPLRNRESYPLAPESFLAEAHVTSTPACKPDPAVELSAARPLIASFGVAVHSCQSRHNDPYSLCLHQDEEELARFVARQPVTAVIDANDLALGATYDGHVVTADQCSSAAGAGDHVVLIVGLLTDAKSGKKAWKVANSYDADWGDKGFAYLEYGWNTCGIANLNHFVQTTCERPVGPNPPPRPALPTKAPATVAAVPLSQVPKKPPVVPAVPVVPIPGAAATPGPKDADTPWWVKEKNAREAAYRSNMPPESSAPAPAAPGAPPAAPSFGPPGLFSPSMAPPPPPPPAGAGPLRMW